MGKLEKSVVLVVLFLISVIMVVSLSTESVDEPEARGEVLASRVALPPADPSPETSTPLPRREPARFAEPPTAAADDHHIQDGHMGDDHVAGLDPRELQARNALEAELDDALATEGSGSDGASGSVGLLNSSVGEGLAPTRLGAGQLTLRGDWDLVTVEGLERSPNPSFLIHVCARSETYETLAFKLYGDPNKAGLLRRNNEGLKRLSEGLEILVPVMDDRGLDAGEYVVQEGESLWVIAKQFYGQGARWGEIFEANRDQLKSPESVREGMTLRIP